MHDDHDGLALPRAEAPLLVAALSGRALAQSARRGGYHVTVLDCFADRDTRLAAARWQVVAAPNSLHFGRRVLLDAAAALAPEAPLVYGSGFEARTGLLARLAAGRTIGGNPPAVVRAVKDARRFFARLDALGIPHPEVRYQPPRPTDGWLVKRSGGAGGTHVRPAGSRPPGARDYFQRSAPGQPMSALFLADGRRAMILGFSQQWTSSARSGLPYLFGGAVGRVPIPDPLAAEIASRLDALVADAHLVGLNGLDFLLDGKRWSVLELNPRPTATVELYDADYDRGLVHLHLEACRGLLPAAARSGPARALAIVHAGSEWQVGEAFDFPLWCRDLPNPGAAIHRGDPVCTVHAEAEDAGEAMRLVQERMREVQRIIHR